MTIQQISSDTGRMLYNGPAPNRGKPVVAKPAVQESIVVQEILGEKSLPNGVIIPENKIPKVEEIKKMIQNNGYPFKSDIYKAIARIVGSDLN